MSDQPVIETELETLEPVEEQHQLRCTERLEKGDAVFAATTIINDGSLPGWELNAVVAEAGTMGMLVNTGHLEERPSQEVLLVCFRDENGEPGPLVTCYPEEITGIPPAGSPMMSRQAH